MASLSGFDASTVEPNGFDPIPAGEYEVAIVASEMKPTKDGSGKYLNLELQVLSGQFQNRKLFDRLNLENKNAQAVQIAKGTLSGICRAVGVLTPKDSSELHLKPMVASVKVRKSDEHGDQNEIKGYKPRHAGQTGSRIQADAPSTNETTAPWNA
jgi:hypothetical protein